MAEHLSGREAVIESLRREILGPDPQGEPIQLDPLPHLESSGQLYGPWRQEDGQEILTRDRPSKRYGAGVLFPRGVEEEDGGDGVKAEETEEIEESPDTDPPPQLSERLQDSTSRIADRAATGGGVDSDDDLDLSVANKFKPSVAALTCLVGATDEDVALELVAQGGRYEPVRVSYEGKGRTWWRRAPVALRASLPVGDLMKAGMHEPTSVSAEGTGDLQLKLQVFSRKHEDGWLCTFCLVNATPAHGSVDEQCLFQSSLRVSATSHSGQGLILPYPSETTAHEQEERELELLYRKQHTFAIGHGCAADWELGEGLERVSFVETSPVPVTEVPNVTPEVSRGDDSLLQVSMAKLAGLLPGEEWTEELEEVVELYERWISRRKDEVPDLPPHLQETAKDNLERCGRAAGRMRAGLKLLTTDSAVQEAFQLMNRAILLQQMTSRREARTARVEDGSSELRFDDGQPSIDHQELPAEKGKWRPFQIAFVLMSLKSVANPTDPDRDLVELIWFPTGGGKTEAYLGLSAFSIFLRRIRDPEDHGVDVIMRYTLRLLTAQQFQRAARLLCAMEHIRRERTTKPGQGSPLGSNPFSIGIWLGTSTTPNQRKYALQDLRGLQRRSKSADDWLVVRQCPWCSAEMGVVESKSSRKWPESAPRVLGYEQLGDGVRIRCPDRSCEFHDRLPIYLIDEDVYEERPSVVIGTVDKFALLAWRPEARSLFGIADDGSRRCSPPTLILQDELHLISGPLGSLVGLYETVIEELCTGQGDNGRKLPPKIVCSTATIRRFPEQVKGLYARPRAELFPPPGLEAGDSFFASYARTREGELLPGKKFVGVHAPGLGSMPTAQVRTFSALLQAPVGWEPQARDPWWTLMVFYNSLRELGTALSLLQSDVPDHLKTIKARGGLSWDEVRTLYEVHELTGRLRDEEIPQAIELLERTTSSHRYPVDVCVASNIIEVGIDIDRLSLMTVVGQPKTTAQYIQVTGRVGRRWWERPGVVVTIYSPSKPRDRSHFEQFRSYHQRLYAQVEPTSVTPFSGPALERALHAVMIAYVRQTCDEDEIESPYPRPEEALKRIREMLVRRADVVDDSELTELERLLDIRTREWVGWKRTIWENRSMGEEAPLIHAAGSYVPPGWVGLSWPTPLSMRNVDAECQAEISMTYLRGDAEHE